MSRAQELAELESVTAARKGRDDQHTSAVSATEGPQDDASESGDGAARGAARAALAALEDDLIGDMPLQPAQDDDGKDAAAPVPEAIEEGGDAADEPMTQEPAAPSAFDGPIAYTQATLQTADTVRHLLWHKALTQDDDDGRRINEYVHMVRASAEGEHVSIRDDLHRDLAIAFELVTRHHMDPWDLDLSKFSEFYLGEAAKRGVDLVTAGRIILMAYTVLKMQSDEVAERAILATQEEEEVLDWDDVPDWSWGDDEWDFTERIQQAPRAPIDEKIRHQGDRRVTLMELIGAFEEVHHEARERQELQKIKLENRLSLQRKMRGKVGNMMHTEDLHAEIAETWQRILEHPSGPIPFSNLHERETVDLVQTFTGVLFLAKDGRIQITQEDFPRGEIYLSPRLPEEVEDADASASESPASSDSSESSDPSTSDSTESTPEAEASA